MSSHGRNSAPGRQFAFIFPGIDQSDVCAHNPFPVKALCRTDAIAAHNRLCLQQPFVLKLHRTKKLHLDFRLCDLQIARSWAMYAMPSNSPEKMRTAIQVGDHLRRHISFEGVHPEGKRGAGPTIVVDRGVWMPLPAFTDIAESLRKGHLGFSLHGIRMRGMWTLIRRPSWAGNDAPRWSLGKEADVLTANQETAKDLSMAELTSVLTGATLDETERRWHEPRVKFAGSKSLFAS